MQVPSIQGELVHSSTSATKVGHNSEMISKSKSNCFTKASIVFQVITGLARANEGSDRVFANAIETRNILFTFIDILACLVIKSKTFVTRAGI